MENNKVVIKRDDAGRIIEIELVTPVEEPDRKPVMELLSAVEAVFGASGESL